jgi:hypothetical protein
MLERDAYLASWDNLGDEADVGALAEVVRRIPAPRQVEEALFEDRLDGRGALGGPTDAVVTVVERRVWPDRALGVVGGQVDDDDVRFVGEDAEG